MTFSIIISLCFNCGRTSKYKRTNRLKDDLFIEIFSAGPIGNLTTDYLTDSINFRVYIGTFDDESERLFYKVSGDSVTVQKVIPKKGFVPGTKTEIEFEKYYKLSNLKAQHNYN